jgi:hypothetical protein
MDQDFGKSFHKHLPYNGIIAIRFFVENPGGDHPVQSLGHRCQSAGSGSIGFFQNGLHETPGIFGDMDKCEAWAQNHNGGVCKKV